MSELIAVGLILIAAVFSAIGALHLKKCSCNISFRKFHNMTDRCLVTGVLLYGMATVVGIPAYRYAELSLIYPFMATSYIWTSLLSIKYLGEKMNWWKWSGIISILLGITLIGLAN